VENKLRSIYLAIVLLIVTGCSQLDNSNDITTLSGQVGKGKALAGSVNVWSQSGKLLGRSKISDGKYSIDIKGYKGIIRVVASITKYHDEKLNQVITTNPIVFSAMSSTSDKNQTKINVTPITDITNRLLYPNILSLSSKEITETNLYIANKIGLGLDYDPTKGDITYLNSTSKDTVQSNDAKTKEAWALMTISNNSALSDTNINPQVNKSKIKKAIDDFYKATLKKMVDPEDKTLATLYEEAFKDTGIKLDGVINNNIAIDVLDNYSIDIQVISELKRKAVRLLNNAGIVQITGDIKEGGTLRAKIIDEDGYTDNIIYQWQTSKKKYGPFINVKNDSKSSAFIVTQNEVNRYIRVITIYKDNTGITEKVISKVTTKIENIDNLGFVTQILGEVSKGGLLHSGEIIDSDGYDKVSYEWLVSVDSNGTYLTIDDKYRSSYTLTANEVDKYIKVKVTYRDTISNTYQTVISDFVGPVTNKNTRGTISDIDGDATVDVVIRAGKISDQDGYKNDASFQWQVSDENDNNKYIDISSDSKESSYRLTDKNLNRYIRVVVSYQDENGTSETLYSNPIGPIKNPVETVNHPGVIDDINGSAIIGIIITSGIITDEDEFSLSKVEYKWQLSNTIDGTYENISGATDINFTISQNEVGKYIRVVGTYKDNRGTNETVISKSIGPIAPIAVNLFTPLDNAQNVSANININISFNKNIIKVNNKNIDIYIENNSNILKRINLDDNGTVKINENNVKIVYDNHLKYGAVHYIKIENGAFKDNKDNNYKGIDNDTTWNFTVMHGDCECDQIDNCDLAKNLQN
jgi:hypothetical protein